MDIGCGLGTIVDFLNSIQKKKYLGIDMSDSAIEKAAIKKANFKVADFVGYKEKSKFDIIIFNEVLYYMDYKKALKKASRMLAEGGKLIVSIYRTKQRHDKEIWQASRIFFKQMDAIRISSAMGKRSTWRIEILDLLSN